MNSLFLEFFVFRFVRVTDDHLVDISLGELLRFDLVFLRCPEKVIEKRHIQLEHLDELDDAAVRHVEFAVEVERPRVGVRTVFGDLPVVDVAGQLGRVLVLLVLRLERADPDTVLLRNQEALHHDMVDHVGPVAPVGGAQSGIVIAAEGAKFPFDDDRVFGELSQPFDDRLPRVPR